MQDPYSKSEQGAHAGFGNFTYSGSIELSEQKNLRLEHTGFGS
jgi:hypothetical protein